MNIFDEVNSLPEAIIAQRLGLTLAKDGKSFLCPDCGNGSGKSGDGIKQTKLKGKLVWHCYRCGGHWSNVDLVALVEGISPSDTAELARRLEELFPESKPFLFSRGEGFSHFSAAERQASKSASGVFGYRSDGDSLASSDSRRSFEPVRASQPVPPKNYAKTFYPRYVETTRKFLAERGGSYRGLTAETFEKYGLVVHPEFGVGDDEKLPTLIISSSALTLMTLTNIFATSSIPLFSNTKKIFSRPFLHHLGNRLSLPKPITRNRTKQASFLCNFLVFLTSTGT